MDCKTFCGPKQLFSHANLNSMLDATYTEKYQVPSEVVYLSSVWCWLRYSNVLIIIKGRLLLKMYSMTIRRREK